MLTMEKPPLRTANAWKRPSSARAPLGRDVTVELPIYFDQKAVVISEDDHIH